MKTPRYAEGMLVDFVLDGRAHRGMVKKVRPTDITVFYDVYKPGITYEITEDMIYASHAWDAMQDAGISGGIPQPRPPRLMQSGGPVSGIMGGYTA